MGAAAGVLSLVLSVVTLALQRRAGQPSRAGRRWAGLGLSAALLSIAVVLARRVWELTWHGIDWLTLGSGGVALASLVAAGIARGRVPKLTGPLRALLEQQYAEAEQPWYDFGALCPPGHRFIYVEQRTTPVRRRTAPEGRLLTVAEMLQRSRNVTVSGGPGAGKSFMVAEIVLRSARWWLSARGWSRPGGAPYGPVIPVVVQARALLDADLPAALATTWGHVDGVTRELFTRPPAPYASWLILIDSLDEVVDPAGRARILRRVGAYLDTDGTGSRVAVASRPLSEGELRELWARDVQSFRLRSFTADDVRAFALGWFTFRLGAPSGVQEEVGRFLSRIRSAGLEPVVRVPLLCSMAALVYDADRDQELPTSRADLYGEFIGLLRRSRDGVEPSGAFDVWLATELSHLLTTLAVAQIRQDRRRLVDVAADWVRANAPDDLRAAPQAAWIGTVRSRLMASGLCTLQGPDIAFIHHSVAEYLAADPCSGCWEPEGIRAGLLDTATRSAALFALARSGLAAEPVVENLLDGGPENLLAAGLVLADGIRVAPPLRRRVIDALFEILRGDDASAPDCLAVLLSLAAAEETRLRLETLAQDGTESVWVRATVADALADLGSPAGPRALRDLASGRSTADAVVRRWAAARLAARSQPAPASRPAAVAPVPAETTGMGVLGRRALKETLSDTGAALTDRMEAAATLYRLSEAVAEQALRDWALPEANDPDTRCRAATVLSQGGDRAGTQVLAGLAASTDPEVPVEVRRRAAHALLPVDTQAGVQALLRIAVDERAPRPERQLAEASLADHGVLVPRRPRRLRQPPEPADPLAVIAGVVAQRWSLEAARQDNDWLSLGAVWTTRRRPRIALTVTTMPDLVRKHRVEAPALLAVIGDAGAGKSTTAAGFVREQLRSRENHEAVAVLLPMSTLTSVTDILGWVVDAIPSAYPELRTHGVTDEQLWRLVRSGRLLLVLDGLDEVPAGDRGPVVRAVTDAVTPTGSHVVLTCRTAEYQELLRRGARSTLWRMPVVSLERLSAGDIASAMESGLTAMDRHRWEPVLTEMRHNPTGRTAHILSSPLLLKLARTVYSSPGTNPTELLDPTLFPARETALRHLLDRFVPAVYDRHRAARAARWLTFLAVLMERQATTSFAWWRLPLAVSQPVRNLVGVLTAVCLLPFVTSITGELSFAVVLSGFFGVVARHANGVRFLPVRWKFHSARGTLRRQRVVTGMTIVITGISSGIGVWIVTDDPATGATAGASIGLAQAALTPWAWWILARIWLATSGLLPWRLLTFLHDADRRGILRSFGDSYGFTHLEAQRHLAGRESRVPRQRG
ncbi:hypothetical protein GCM10010166_60670 [Couchioplanes caeruleus subsp. azureus]|nr:hypothetical protein GCM10010166_60670 [Couchioplanes caeruleus subsp. azureus]